MLHHGTRRLTWKGPTLARLFHPHPRLPGLLGDEAVEAEVVEVPSLPRSDQTLAYPETPASSPPNVSAAFSSPLLSIFSLKTLTTFRVESEVPVVCS